VERVGPVSVGGLNLLAPPAWCFFEFSNLILGRRDNGVGTLQISTAFRRDVVGKRSAAAFEELARQWVDGDLGPFEDDRHCAMARRVNDMGWVWYLVRSGQLILATYQPRSGEVDEHQVASEYEEAAAILRAAEWKAG
jgi:hypothetical protein